MLDHDGQDRNELQGDGQEVLWWERMGIFLVLKSRDLNRQFSCHVLCPDLTVVGTSLVAPILYSALFANRCTVIHS